MTPYVFSAAPLVDQQLARIAEAFDAVTADRLHDVGVRGGWRCLEVGAGNGSIAHRLTDLVGPDGRVEATDVDLDHLEPTSPGNLVIRRHDVTRDALPDSAYDLIHARLVLMHLPQRRDVLTRLRSALRPDGWLLTEDYDLAPPPDLLAAPNGVAAAVYDRVVRALSAVTDAAGIDRGWGSAAYAAFLAAGFVEVATQMYARSTPSGAAGSDLLATYVRQLRAPVLGTGLVSEADIDRFLELARDPGFVQRTPTMVSTWGRRPPADGHGVEARLPG